MVEAANVHVFAKFSVCFFPFWEFCKNVWHCWI